MADKVAKRGNEAKRPQKSRRLIIGLLLMPIMAMSVASCGDSSDAAGDDEKVVLKVAEAVPADHFLATGSKVFKKEVEARTDGQVEVDIFPSEQLGEVGDALELVDTGVADIAYLAPVSLPEGTMPISGAFTLPRLVRDGKTEILAYSELSTDPESILYQTDFEANDVHPVYVGGVGPLEPMTTDTPITGLDVFDGLLMRSGGGTIDLVTEALGAKPVTISTGEIYEALQRGTVDGNLQNPGAALGTSLDELIGDMTSNAHLGGFVAAWGMKQSRYDGFSDEIRAAIDEAGAIATRTAANQVDAETADAFTKFEEAGATLVKLSPDELAELDTMMEPVTETWLGQIEEDGVDGDAALEEVQAAVAHVE